MLYDSMTKLKDRSRKSGLGPVTRANGHDIERNNGWTARDELIDQMIESNLSSYLRYRRINYLHTAERFHIAGRCNRCSGEPKNKISEFVIYIRNKQLD